MLLPFAVREGIGMRLMSNHMSRHDTALEGSPRNVLHSSSYWLVRFETQPYAPSFHAMSVDRALLLSAARLGISVFKQEKERAIRSFVGGSDVFVSLLTGYGVCMIW